MLTGLALGLGLEVRVSVIVNFSVISHGISINEGALKREFDKLSNEPNIIKIG